MPGQKPKFKEFPLSITADIKIHRALLEDLENVVPLFDAYRQFYEYESNPAGCRAFIDQRLRSGDSVIFLATIQNVAIGFAQLYPSLSSLAMSRIWILNDMLVLPSARKRGVGAGLLKRIEDFAAETNARSIVLETAPDNVKSKALYERNGYVLDDEFQHYCKKI